MSDQNRNLMISNNSVFTALKAYESSNGFYKVPGVLNGDKVFWERRTDSLLYDADIQLDGEVTELLNNFQLVDLQRFSWEDGVLDWNDVTGAVDCPQGTTIHIRLSETSGANCLTLYDHPDSGSNILSGSVLFSDGTTVEFGELERSGGATNISFPEKELQWLEITVTQTQGDHPGLTEIELYCNTDEKPESLLMAMDPEGNFVYDYTLQDQSSVALELYQFPYGKMPSWEGVDIAFEATGADCSYTLQDGQLIIHCSKNETCTVTVSKDGVSTTFTVSNPVALSVFTLYRLRSIDWRICRSEYRLRQNIQRFFEGIRELL